MIPADEPVGAVETAEEQPLGAGPRADPNARRRADPATGSVRSTSAVQLTVIHRRCPARGPTERDGDPRLGAGHRAQHALDRYPASGALSQYLGAGPGRGPGATAFLDAAPGALPSRAPSDPAGCGRCAGDPHSTTNSRS